MEFAGLRDEIERLGLLARQFRIVRALAGIASLRYSKKRIDSGEQDRIQELGHLWESKRDFEIVQMHMLQQVEQAYKRLTDCELEIDRLTQQLEAEKQSTIQMVHWKSTNLRREEQLLADLKLVEHAGSVHIGNLLQKLASQTEVLEELRANAEEMELEIERSVRMPIRKSAGVRSSIRELKIKKAARVKGLTPIGDFATPDVQQLREENVELRARNAGLRLEIQQMEEALRQFSKQTVTFSEDLIPAARQALRKTSGTTKKGQITRPKTSYSSSRPGFEFLSSRTRR
jgi:protein-arginine kinase activator protein McsA